MLFRIDRKDEANVIHEQYDVLLPKQKELLSRKNKVDTQFYNGVYERYNNPVITRHHVPLHWRFDLNKETNPHFMERLGVNSTFNPGAIYYKGKYILVVRMEGLDRKSIFALAESDNGIDGFRFIDQPLTWEDIDAEETNTYDMRLVQHEDGWIYGIYCSESNGGHGMIFTTFDDRLMLTLHSPNETLKERPKFYELTDEHNKLRLAP